METGFNLEISALQIRSGVTIIKDLTAVREKVYEAEVDVIRVGSVEDLGIVVARLRKEHSRVNDLVYMPEVAALLASKALWETRKVTLLDQFKKPTTLEEHFREEKNKD
jgi:hypothetical protein